MPRRRVRPATRKVAINTQRQHSGSFSYTATAGDGSYGFYTVATDNAGNAQATPAGAQATTVLDSTAPSSTASSPALTNQTSFERLLHRDRRQRRAGAGRAVCPGAGSDWLHEGRDEHQRLGLGQLQLHRDGR